MYIADWKKRLTALADNPGYVFVDTPPDLIARHYLRLTKFSGYTEWEVAAVEKKLDVEFPEMFRHYLLEMGKSPGDLFRGSDLAATSEFENFHAKANALLAETDPALKLPRDAVVWLFHHDCTFVYLHGVGGSDGPTMQWTETEREPREVAVTFAAMIDAELRLMEENNREWRARGGYYKTLCPDEG
ncbi:SMI1/KNR4 family protein [Anatilimnocola floriformis]|uniref:SMI1/KNR4 family protein n=1 Tax=Anatilimnocola floriformis TaxID=2948575 RepID=UPI0020C3E9A4|nr:SMI1/KNR4 family protein [Anatilimnocola floriformis]